MQDSALVCFVLPGISKSAESSSLIVNRINLYTKTFIEKVGPEKSKAILLCSGLVLPGNQKLPLENTLQTYVFSTRKVNLLSFLIRSYKVLNLESHKKITLVAGDNYGALLICLTLKRLLAGNVVVQISIHGNPLTHNPYTAKTLVRRLFFRLFVPRATSIRLVSGHLEKELGRYFGKSAEILVCPIPIELPPFPERAFKKWRLGVVGRLHYERGADQLRGILDSFAKAQSDINFQIIGDGPERTQFESLRVKYPSLNLEISGSLSHSEVLSSYSKFSLLLSCALSEGYGLALREAILSGVPVVAKENLGTQALREIFPGMVFLFDSTDEAVELILSKMGFPADPKLTKCYRDKQIELDKNSLTALVTSWA